MTVKLAYGKCRVCGALADAPTFKCSSCGTNNVELFSTPHAPDTEGPSRPSRPLKLEIMQSLRGMSRGDAFWSFFVWLFIAAVGAVVGAVMAGAAVLAEFLICGDRADCGPHSFWVLAPERAFWLLAAGAGLIAVAAAVLAIGSLLLALFPGRRT